MHQRNPANLKISKALMDDVVNYLATRPYGDVANLMQRIVGEVAPQVAPKVTDGKQHRK
jgi:hypothetical protein